MKRYLILLLLTFVSLLPLGAQQVRNVHDTFNLSRISSPEKTWQSLIDLTDTYGEIIMDEGYTPENEAFLLGLENQITKLFDLRQVPPSLQETQSIESAVYIREILARFQPLEEGALPDRAQAFKDMKDGQPPMWSVNDTDMVIVYIDSGPFLGSFQFSERTMLYADEMYHATKKLSYLDESVKGFHEAYFLTPGPMIPSSWIRALPSWTYHDYANQSIWQWGCLFFSLLILLVALYCLYLAVTRVSFNWSPFPRGLSRLLLLLLITWMTSFWVEFLEEDIFITGGALATLRYVDELVELIALISAVIILGNTLIGINLRRNENRYVTIDAQLVRFGIRIGTMLLAVILLIQGLSRMGVPLATVLTGAGVTGLAIALAAQESLRNIFGSMMILLDKPFTLGQRILIKGQDGVVEEIGLRSTKVRLLNGHLASIPNEVVAKTDIVNIGKRPFIRRLFNVRIDYHTSPEKIDEAQAIIRDVLSVKDVDGQKQNESINQEDFPPRVYFNDLKEDALNIIVIYWHFPPDYWAFMEQATAINRELVRRFNDAGIRFAMPTQTVQLEGGSGEPIVLDKTGEAVE